MSHDRDIQSSLLHDGGASSEAPPFVLPTRYSKRTAATVCAFRDAQNKPAVAVFNGTSYAHIDNLQDDVIALVDSTGAKVVEYSYDAWGRIMRRAGAMANTPGSPNPFRCRGYVYDEEIGLYYLCSRYYFPVQCRFIISNNKQDEASGHFAYNLFCYCANNPIQYSDPSGYDLWDTFTDALYETWVAPWVNRYEEMCAAPNAYTISNYLTGGLVDNIKGAVVPDKPLSLDHWLDSFATVSIGYSFYSGIRINIPQKIPADPVEKALKQLSQTNLRPGQTVLSRSRVLSITNNFDPQLAQSYVYTSNGVRYLVEGHHTTVASVILDKGTCMNMGIATNQIPSAQNIYWWRKWWEIWKKTIKIIP